MPDKSMNTPGVSEPEVSAMAQRAKTAAFPDDTNVSGPRCYNQCVEAPVINDEGSLPGNGPAYD